MTRALPQNPKVLIVGNGAREHAIAWSLAKSPLRPTLYAAPGNPGIASLATCVEIPVTDVGRLVDFAVTESIHFVVVGPEVPLSLGLVDECFQQGIPAFGPAQEAARLESSKAFAKELMLEAGVPTAHFATFENPDAAKAYVRGHGAPIVIKADGLAAGKGVVVAETLEEAFAAIDDMLVGNKFGASGHKVVIEQFLAGEEVSLMFFVDANTVVPMLSARDHKRIGEGNTGPNTGGMGAFAPVPGFAENGSVEAVKSRIVEPLLSSLRAKGITYRGVLYAGLMMTADGPYVIEFNCRFGDPETEVILPLLQSDLLEVAYAVATDRLGEVNVAWNHECAVCVVLASSGYPESPRVGDVIKGDCLLASSSDGSESGTVFHAGTKQAEAGLVTAGGRVLVCSGTGRTFADARSVAYHTAEQIYFDGKQLRRDIGGGLLN